MEGSVLPLGPPCKSLCRSPCKSLCSWHCDQDGCLEGTETLTASILSSLALSKAGEWTHQEVLFCVFHMELVSHRATHAFVLSDFHQCSDQWKHWLTKNAAVQLQVAPTGTSLMLLSSRRHSADLCCWRQAFHLLAYTISFGPRPCS